MVTRVLIAEDDPHIVESLSFVLTRGGYEVSAVLDGEAAVKAVREDPVDIVILDVMLPKLNGFEVLKAIRSDSALKDLPVVVLTAKGQTQDRRMAEELGVSGFMTKPFSNRDIVEQVRRLTHA